MENNLPLSSDDKRKANILIAICWAVYASSYISKLNYAANINGIMSCFSVSHAEAGLVSTCFFFAYGIGQVINGFLCKKYNIRLYDSTAFTFDNFTVFQ